MHQIRFLVSACLPLCPLVRSCLRWSLALLLSKMRCVSFVVARHILWRSCSKFSSQQVRWLHGSPASVVTCSTDETRPRPATVQSIHVLFFNAHFTTGHRMAIVLRNAALYAYATQPVTATPMS